jgi:hypothetical protein
MMKALIDTPDFAVILGFEIRRWYVGMAYEPQNDDVRAFVFRLGPFFLHLIHQPDA